MRLLAGLAASAAALIIGVLAALVMERPPPTSFSMERGEDGAGIWRLDNRDGRVSVCGSSLTGRALSQAEMQLTAQIRAAGHDIRAQAALVPQIDEVDNLARPRCSPWSAGEGDAKAELDLNAPE